MQDYQMMLKAYQKAGGTPDIFKDPRIAHLVVNQNNVLGSQSTDGLTLTAKEKERGIDVDLEVEEGIRIAHPVHLCFGVLPKEGRQEIRVNAFVKKGAEIRILAHCVFPNPIKVQHVMNALYTLEDRAVLTYEEVHYHGLTGGIEVIPQAKIKVGKDARIMTNFLLIKGRVGRLDIDYQAEADENGKIEMVAKVYGHGDDKIRVKESVLLFGEGARGLIKSRIAVRERAESEVVSELGASAPNARGHVDCVEIVQGEAVAKAVPVVSVLHKNAQVTHEAAIGRVNQKELETLMARGLKEEEAVEVIIGGMLK
ncbi:MAG: SufD family Fe-S cluster assembly protein [Desulfatiglandales bacterium]